MTEIFPWLVLCAAGVGVTLAAEHRSNSVLAAAGKLTAASAYIVAAVSLGATGSVYGQVLLTGMFLCWLGDMLLVSIRSQGLFLLGLASFLLGHVAYIGAFMIRGVSLAPAMVACLAMAVFSFFVLRWLNPHLDNRMRRPVWIYVAAISLMMAMAAGTHAASENWLIPLGALLFLVSDLSVARDRFVASGFINRAWGLPVYFGAQMILALSVVRQ